MSELSPTALLISQCSVELRDLPSFPTRRSSDLARNAPKCGGRALRLERVGDRLPYLQRGAIRLCVPCGWNGGSHIDESLDRKSTRLNSSHITISYAVFCLKKKKTQDIYS